MLLEFRVENHRSIREEQVLTLLAGRVGDESDSRPRVVRGYTEKILPAAAIYGANASGKSNVIAALNFMRDAVASSHRVWDPEKGVPRDPFAWGKWRTKPSVFETSMVIDGVWYDYGFAASDQEFLEEWLFAYPQKKRQSWFEREAGVFTFGDKLRGENRRIERTTRPNSLFLSAAAQSGHAQLAPITHWFTSLNCVFAKALNSVQFLLTRFLDPRYSDFLKETLLSYLNAADLGIIDIKTIAPNNGDQVPRILVRHDTNSRNAWLPIEQESQGTLTMLRLAFPILDALASGHPLFVDELESSLHPALASEIVDMFNDPKFNHNNAQLIFTTHDTNFIGTTRGDPVLRRDQIWLTEKNKHGATELYPLTDFQPRKSENLERGYLQGRYGAIPCLGDVLSAQE